MPLRPLIAALCCLALSGCFLRPYKMDIQQGNYLDQAQVAKLRPGMTHAQVRFLLGTPLVVDPFHSDRWDYLYVDQQRGRLTDYRRLTLHFDGDKLVRAQTDLPLDKPAQKQVAAPPSR